MCLGECVFRDRIFCAINKLVYKTLCLLLYKMKNNVLRQKTIITLAREIHLVCQGLNQECGLLEEHTNKDKSENQLASAHYIS